MTEQALYIILFATQVVKLLFPSNEFVSRSVDMSSQMVNASKAIIPADALPPEVMINPTVFPLPVSNQQLNKIEFDLFLAATKPQLIKDMKTKFLAPDAAREKVQLHISAMQDAIMFRILHSWVANRNYNGVDEALPQAQILKTTGADNGDGFKSVTLSDIVRLRKLFGNNKIPASGRYLVVPPNMDADLLKIDDFIRADAYGASNIPEGAIGKIYGFTVFVRPEGPTWDVTGTPTLVEIGETPLNECIVAFHEGSVARANSNFEEFMNMRDALYQGDIYSTAGHAGGHRLRNEGVAVLIHDTV